VTYSMPEPAKAEILALADEALNRCRAVFDGYSTSIPCERPAGHPGRHWSDSLGCNWPAT
jgi:hypothetical protein